VATLFKGTRLSVDFLLGLLAEGWTKSRILENYPQMIYEVLQVVGTRLISSLRLPKNHTHTPIGKITERYRHEIPLHFTFVKLGEFVVMPNHIHGIAIIDRPADDCGFLVDERRVRMENSPVETLHATSLPTMSKFHPNRVLY